MLVYPPTSSTSSVSIDRLRAVDILGFYRPAESCSGDWWWFEQEADGRYAILVGDVTGHGPGPAMVTAAVATAYRVQSLAGGDIEERLHVINSEVLRVSRGKYQMTLTAIVVDIVSGEYTIYSAEDVLIGTKTGTLSPGARVILYTDGIPETDMANGKQLGMRRFAKLFGDTMEMALPLASRHLVDVGDMHREERPQDDDWTFVIAQWRGPGELSVEQRG
jgi:serine phosphatase RsbU (regulator of sigma subunit)